MELSKLSILFAIFFFQALLFHSSPAQSASNSNNNSKLFREYIGAEFKNVTFSDLPIDPRVDFHFILSFAIDYTLNLSSPSPTNGNFNVFWDKHNLTPSQVLAIKKKYPNVKVAVSLGGDSVGSQYAYFDRTSEKSWVSNAVSSLTTIIHRYHLDGIDVDYEHFRKGNRTFARCIGKLIGRLKGDGTISFASIAPYDDDRVQSHYKALWRSYKHLIDYVNFQFYAYDKRTNVSQFMGYFAEQSRIYEGGKIIASFISDGSGGLGPDNGFFTACRSLKKEGKLHGIFGWCADDSKGLKFKYEKMSQSLLARSD